MTTKQLIPFIILPILGWIIIYLLAAYSNWDFNPGNWSRDSRLLTSALYIVTIIFGFMGADIIKKDKS
jgi:hypothetical protein